jgi:uncharacterized protein (DUF58 family)
MALTRLGWGMVGVAIAAYAASATLGYPELAVPGVACLLAVGASLAWTLPAPRLRVHRDIAPAQVVRGDPAIGVVTVVNTGRRVRAALKATDVCGHSTITVALPEMPVGGRRTASYQLPTRRRGIILVGPLRITRADPFGFSRRVRTYGTPVILTVHPRTYPLPMLPSGRARHLEGPASDKALSGSMTFHAVRDYAPGDDMRLIHWRSTARTGTLMVRQMMDASLPRTTILLDIRAENYRQPGNIAAAPGPDANEPESEPFEIAVDAAASIAVAAAQNGFPVRVLTTACALAEGKGDRAAAAALLKWFAAVTPDSGGSLAAALTMACSRGGGSLVVVTAALPSAESKLVAAARPKFERVVVIRVNAAADALAGPPGVGLVDAADAAGIAAGWCRVTGMR